MLNILKKYELKNVLVVVTRYFGGILLGTGGLVRAYSDATIGAIEESNIVTQELGLELFVLLDYSEFSHFQYYCNKNSINILKIQYEDNIKCTIEVSLKNKDKLLHEIEEKLLNVIEIKVIKEKYV